jgi:hypothetical protein
MTAAVIIAAMVGMAEGATLRIRLHSALGCRTPQEIHDEYLSEHACSGINQPQITRPEIAGQPMPSSSLAAPAFLFGDCETSRHGAVTRPPPAHHPHLPWLRGGASAQSVAACRASWMADAIAADAEQEPAEES